MLDIAFQSIPKISQLNEAVFKRLKENLINCGSFNKPKSRYLFNFILLNTTNTKQLNVHTNVRYVRYINYTSS